MAMYVFTPQLKKYMTARLNDEGDPVIVTGAPIEGDLHYIFITTFYAMFRVPRPIYQMTFQTYLHREPPGPGEGFRMHGNQPVDVDRQRQQWEQMKSDCKTPALLTPYFLEAASGKAKGVMPQLRLLWANPLAIWIDTAILNTVDVRWGVFKAAASALSPVHYEDTDIEAIFLPFKRWGKDDEALDEEAALAKAWCEQKMGVTT